MTTAQQWGEFVRREPAGFAWGETCCCAFVTRWAGVLCGKPQPGRDILNTVKGVSAGAAFLRARQLGGLVNAMRAVLLPVGWKEVHDPADFCVVIIEAAGTQGGQSESAAVWVDGKAISKTEGSGGICVISDPKVKGIFVWE